MSSDDVKITVRDDGESGLTVYRFESPTFAYETALDVGQQAALESYFRARFAAEGMPEDVKALVERVKALAVSHRVQARDGFRPDHAEQADLFEQIHTALEAAYSQKAEAWDEGANAELARARSQGADDPSIPHPMNPYRMGAE